MLSALEVKVRHTRFFMHLFFDLETADTLSLLSESSDFVVFFFSNIDFSFGSLMRHVGRVSTGERNKIRTHRYFFLYVFVPRPSLKDLHLAEGDRRELRASDRRSNIKVSAWLLFRYPTVADNDL